jgi:hypothetical protein
MVVHRHCHHTDATVLGQPSVEEGSNHAVKWMKTLLKVEDLPLPVIEQL